MKNAVKVLTVIVLAAVIGFGVTGCEQPTDSSTAKTLTGITLNTDSVKKAYVQNETLNLSGLVVTATYSDGSSAAVAEYTANPANGTTLSEIETKTVTVSYTEEAVTKTADFSVTVTAKTLTGITAEYTGTTHVYPFTLLDSLKDHLTVTAQYSDGSSTPLEAEDYELSGELTVGTSTITASYTEGGVTKTDTFDVTVTAATLDSIAVTFDQDDAAIYTSTPLDNIKQYLTVTATYTFTGSQETHEETLSAHEYTLSGELTAGTPTITVNYGGKTGNFTPDVTAVVLDSITAAYTGGDVEINSDVDDLKDALTVTAHYNDGSTETPSNYSLSGDVSTIGQKTIIASYTDGGVTKTDTFTVTVVCNHDWQWIQTATETEDGEETETCSICGTTGETRTQYAIGTAGLNFALISINGGTNNAYRVSRGTATGAIVIPAFYRSNTESPYLPVTETSSGSDSSNAFGGTSSNPNTTVTSITFAEGSQLTTISDYTFQYCSSLASVTIPDSVTSIDQFTFNGCTSLTGITIPAGVTSIGQCAFQGCTSLTGINILAGVTSIGLGAFAFCGSLTSITIPDSVTYIDQFTFNGCSSLTSINIPAGVTYIDSGAFYNCSSLTAITIPASVTYIGNIAFNGCTSLATVIFQGTIASGSFNANTPFPGDLRDKFYATNSANGTPGTYTRPNGSSNTWTRQP